jgi:hypothetical protein
MKYRDNMSEEELKAFMREVDELHNAYTRAAEHDAKSAQQAQPPDEWEDETDTLRRAALDHRGNP